ncbi:MAG: hypothetical protein KF716_08540 [Anaerolineae bacterium]|nr:hypothetical protein [Anaerolineae bacterium]
MRKEYSKPLNEFLNSFAKQHRDLNAVDSPKLEESFRTTIDIAYRSLGRLAFRSQRVLNAAVFDATMVGIAERLKRGDVHNLEQIKQAHDALLSNPDFTKLYTGSTTDEKNVAERVKLAIAAFEGIE